MATTTSGPGVLTTPQAGKRVHRSDETIRRWIAEGRLRARLVGGRWFVDAQSLAALEREQDGEPR
jgi:excisionase family DNA binding protein